MFDKSEKKLLLECVEHFMSWQNSMGRSTKTIKETHSFLGDKDIISKEIPTAQTIMLEKMSNKLKEGIKNV
tara:strand:+ start:2098 stop:2310 length:213 start_codon:yes stop_codon:yes gene_type:complete